MNIIRGKLLFLLTLFLCSRQVIFAQSDLNEMYRQRFQNGAGFYREARMQNAAAEFRRAQEIAPTAEDWSRALYWVILSQLAMADYASAIRDMDELERQAPNSGYASEMTYHRARAYFNLGYFEDALILFQRYNDSITDNNVEETLKKAAAFFWMGECLYSMGQFEEAEKFFAWIISSYPGSPKFEASTYRIDIIKQKKIEAELLELLRWSHEEALRTGEEYRRRLRTYEHTLNNYQRRITELSGASIQGGISNDILRESEAEAAAAALSASRSEQSSVRVVDEALIERARQLGINIQRIISDHEQHLNAERQNDN